MNTNEGKTWFGIGLDDRELRSQINSSKSAFQELGDKAVAEGERIDSMFQGLKRTAASIGLAWSMQEFAQKVATVRGEFQQLEVAMETMLGSAPKAQALMSQLVQTAATTPFGLQEVAGGAKQLLAYGLEAEKVNDTLIRLGDIAAGLSIPLGDLVYLYGTTMAQGRLYTQDLNQFTGRGIPMIKELAAQFGVAESKVKGLVEEGKVGFPEVQKVIENLTNEGGTFGGLMEKQSHTITGQISNIEDAFDMMFNEIGQNSEGFINDALEATSWLVEHYEITAEALMTLVATYGVYKATLMATTAYTNAAYNYEATQLKVLLADKGASIDADLAGAVAKGRMTAARAQEVQALRAELAAKIENARVIAIEAQAEASEATRKRMLAQLAYNKARAEVEAKQEEIVAMESIYAHQTAETLQKEKDVLVTKMHAAQEKLDAAAKIENAAKTKAVTTAQAVNTLTTARDTIAKKLNVAQTKLLAVATNGLTKALKSLKAAWASNPIGLILMGVTLVAGALMTFGDAMEASSIESHKFGEAAAEISRNVDTLFAVIKSTSGTSKVHADAVDELCKIYEEYGLKIDNEKDKLAQLNEMREEAIRLIREEGEERDKANNIASYDEAIGKSTEKMKEELLKQLKSAEWDGTGIIDDWDANAVQDRADELATVIGRIYESEADAIAKITDPAELEAKMEDIKAKVQSAYSEILKDVGTERGTDGKKVGDMSIFALDVDWLGILEEYTTKTKSLISARDRLSDSYKKNTEGAKEEATAIDYEKLSFDKLFDAAYNVKEKVEEVNGQTAEPDIKTTQIDEAIGKVNTLIDKINALGGVAITAPVMSVIDGLTKGAGALSAFNDTTDSAQQKAQAEIERRMAEAIKSRKGTADLLKEVNEELETAISGSENEKMLLSFQRRLNNQKKKFDSAGRYSDRIAKMEKAELDSRKVLEENAKARMALENDLAFQEEQNSINLEKDAAERRRRQFELNQKKERSQLDKQMEAAIKAEIQRQKSYFDSVENIKAARDETYVKQNFTDADIDYAKIEKIKELYKKLAQQLREQQKLDRAEFMEEELAAMRDYLKEYGSFEQRKLAITEEYEKKIRDAETEGERLKLKKEKEHALSALTFENISMGIDWSALLKGVGSLSHEMMQPMLEQLEAYAKTDEYAKADMQEREKVTELIQELREYIGTDKNAGWETLAKAITDFAAGVAKYKELEKREKEAIAARDNAKLQLERGEITQEDFDKISAEADRLGEETAAAAEEMRGLGNTLNETSDAVKNYVSPLSTALNKLDTWKGIEGFGNVKSGVADIDMLKGALDGVLPGMSDGIGKELGKEISSALGSVLGSIGGDVTSLLSTGIGSVIGIIAQIPKLILDLVKSIKDMVTGVLDSFTELISLRWIDDLVNGILNSVGELINAIFDLPENLYHVVESIVVDGVGSLLNTVLGRLGNILTLGVLGSGGPADWFTNSNGKEVQDTINRLTERNELLQTAIEDLTDEIKASKGTKSVAAYREAYDLQKETNANYLDMAMAQAGYHGSHHSWSYYWGGFTKEEIADFSKQIGRSWNGDIWNLSPEEMKKLRENVAMWSKIMNTGKGGYGERLTEKLDDYIDQAGKLEELTNQLYEGLTGISFDSMYDSFIDQLMDMEASAEDFADNINEYFMRAMLSNKIGELYSDKLNEWWKKFGAAMEDNNLSESERNALSEEYMSYVEDAMKLRDEIAAATGYDKTSASSQNSSKKGYATASQDSIDELNGRFTAIQMDTSIIKESLSGISGSMSGINLSITELKQHTDEIRNLSLMAIEHLQRIVKNTNELPKMNERLERIEKNTRKL